MYSFKNLVKDLKKHNGVYMLIGHGSKNQIRNLKNLNKVLNNILKEAPKGSAFLYFGDSPNKKKPDVGYAFELLKKKRPDLCIYMIQINKAKSWGVPTFVKKVYWHNDYTKKCTWGGVQNNKPCSNTKKWVSLNRYVKISKVFILGGGEITLDEYNLIKKYNIDYKYFPIERRFMGDGKTKVTSNKTKKLRVGVTFNKIN